MTEAWRGRLLVASDLDGSLLDEETYAWEAAREALEALALRRIPLVLCSSKTRAEMEPLARALPTESPLVVENGGALLIPVRHLTGAVAGATRRADHWVVTLGTPRDDLVGALGAIASEIGAALIPFTSLSPEELAAHTGLRGEAAARAREREFDEPFLLTDEGHAEAVARAAERRGLQVTRGGRFWHLTGSTDKGRALRTLLDLHADEGRNFTTLGLGDSANDLPLLRAVDRPVIIPRPGGWLDPDLADGVPEAEHAPEPGPRGWNAAVLAVLRGEQLPRASREAEGGSGGCDAAPQGTSAERSGIHSRGAEGGSGGCDAAPPRKE